MSRELKGAEATIQGRLTSRAFKPRSERMRRGSERDVLLTDRARSGLAKVFTAAMRDVARAGVLWAGGPLAEQKQLTFSKVGEGDRAFDLCHTGDGHLLGLINGSIRNTCGCAQPRHAEIFDRGRMLGLLAVTLSVGSSGPVLGLILDRGRFQGPDQAFCIATFDASGDVRAEAHVPALSRTSYLRHRLGAPTTAEGLLMRNVHADVFETTVGFPGALTYISERLPLLGEYLTDLGRCPHGLC